jgi:hypothetical protein
MTKSFEAARLLEEAPRLIAVALKKGWATKPTRQMSNAEVDHFRSKLNNKRNLDNWVKPNPPVDQSVQQNTPS